MTISLVPLLLIFAVVDVIFHRGRKSSFSPPPVTIVYINQLLHVKWYIMMSSASAGASRTLGIGTPRNSSASGLSQVRHHLDESGPSWPDIRYAGH